MSITLHAQPYDISASGFYFCTEEEFDEKARQATNTCGDPIEEFEIQFIDGQHIDCDLAKAISLNQGNFRDFLTCIEAWEDWEKINVIIAVGDCGYDFDPEIDPDHYGVELYYVRSLRELAEEFVSDGLYGEIPENLQFYIDYDAIARDLAMEYSEAVIAGDVVIYRAS